MIGYGCGVLAAKPASAHVDELLIAGREGAILGSSIGGLLLGALALRGRFAGGRAFRLEQRIKKPPRLTD